MRKQLKFRSWHFEQKRMFEVYGLGSDFVTENTFDGVDPGTNAFCGDDMNFIEIMQYTGLKDKKGIDIYEGDIVQLEYIVAPVYWFNGSFHIGLNKDQGSNNFIQERAKKFIVLGNVYETPELISTESVFP